MVGLAGCAVGGTRAAPPPATPGARTGGVAAQVEVAPDDPAPSVAPAPGPAPTGPGTTAPGASRPPTSATAAPGGPTSTTASTAPAPTRPVLHLDDARGDAGLAVPGYGDLTGTSIDRVGADAVVTVAFAAALPAHLGAHETIGVGVDLYPPGAGESAHQLFVEGGADGWFAYLFQGRDQVPYPGTVALRGATIRLRVPAVSLGASGAAALTVFCDWSGGGSTPLDGKDHAPELGRTPFTWPA